MLLGRKTTTNKQTNIVFLEMHNARHTTHIMLSVNGLLAFCQWYEVAELLENIAHWLLTDVQIHLQGILKLPRPKMMVTASICTVQIHQDFFCYAAWFVCLLLFYALATVFQLSCR